MDLIQMAAIVGLILFTIETLILFMMIFSTGGIPLTLLKAKFRKKPIGILEGNDRTREFFVCDPKENLISRKDIGSWSLSPEKIIPLKGSDIQSIWFTPNLPEGITAKDVKHGFTYSPQMIERYNERKADAIAKEKLEKDPQQMIIKIGMIAAIVLAVGIVGYLLLNAISEIHFCDIQVDSIRTVVTTFPPVGGGNYTIDPGIY